MQFIESNSKSLIGSEQHKDGFAAKLSNSFYSVNFAIPLFNFSFIFFDRPKLASSIDLSTISKFIFLRSYSTLRYSF